MKRIYTPYLIQSKRTHVHTDKIDPFLPTSQRAPSFQIFIFASTLLLFSDWHSMHFLRFSLAHGERGERGSTLKENVGMRNTRFSEEGGFI